VTADRPRAPRELGVLIPAHRDGARARDAVRALLAGVERAEVPVTIVVADDGGNDGFAGGLPADPNVRVVEVARRGPGHARTAASRSLVEGWRGRGVPLDDAWIVSLDADVDVAFDFLEAWTDVLARAEADVLCAPAHFAALPGEPPLLEDVRAASAWLWSHAAWFERFVGVVNVGGCNHAVRASVCDAVDHYLQPVETVDGVEHVVPGDDWDFGLRARLRGFRVERVPGPECLTSARRIARDPAGFLAGWTYEGPFRSVLEIEHRPAWPPREDWPTLADRGRTRIAAHFLLKPLLAGLPPEPSLRWFLGDAMWERVLGLERPAVPASGDWVEFRRTLVARLFEPEVFDLAGRVARRLSGVPS
jgi:GT2 family glycosyltransferase